MKLPKWLNRLLSVWYLKRKGVVWSGEVPLIDMLRPPVFMVEGDLELGSNVEFLTDTVRTRIHVDKGAVLLIRSDVVINNAFQIRASKNIYIGPGSGIGPFVTIRDRNHHELYPGYEDTPRPVHLGRSCFVGEFSSIMPGAQLGDNAFVGSHSKVRGDKPFPANVIIEGVPAVVVKPFDPEKMGYPGWFRKRK